MKFLFTKSEWPIPEMKDEPNQKEIDRQQAEILRKAAEEQKKK